jgi:hypothetical protein
VQIFIEKLKAMAAHFKEKFDVRLGFVFVDTVSASFDIEEECDNAEAARVCKTLRRVGEEIRANAVPIHHYGKDAAVGLRGASAWRANADIILSVTADIDPVTGHVTNRQLSIAKDRDGAQGPLTAFALKWIELGTDEDGKPFGSMVAVAEEGVTQTASQWPSHLLIFRQALSEAILAKGYLNKPYPDGPELKVVNVEDVKAFFATLTHVDSKKQGTGEATEEARQDAIRKQFARKLEQAQTRRLIGFVADTAGHGKIWLAKAAPDKPDRS